MRKYSNDWIEDCMHYHGRVLTGTFGHWCYDWDQLPVDETCREFECCSCFSPQLKKSMLAVVKMRRLMKNKHARFERSRQAWDTLYNARIRVPDGNGDYLPPMRYGPL